jgi:hypothetical protein
LSFAFCTRNGNINGSFELKPSLLKKFAELEGLDAHGKARTSGKYRFADAPQKSEMALHDKPADSK